MEVHPPELDLMSVFDFLAFKIDIFVVKLCEFFVKIRIKRKKNCNPQHEIQINTINLDYDKIMYSPWNKQSRIMRSDVHETVGCSEFNIGHLNFLFFLNRYYLLYQLL